MSEPNSSCRIRADNSYLLVAYEQSDELSVISYNVRIYRGSVGPGLSRKLRKFGVEADEISKEKPQ